MNQTEIMKEPRDCFAVLQLFPAARHTAASATPVACRKSASASDVRFCFT